VDDWIGLRDAAGILGVSVATVYRSVLNDADADAEWGPGNWRRKPLIRRREIQLRRDAVEKRTNSTD